MELASLKEYLEPLAPKTVLWFFFEGNDISENLPFERKSRLLMSYLNNDEFRQGLMNNNGEVSKRLKLYLDEHLLAMIEQMQGPFENLLDFIQIYHLRRQLGLGVVSLGLFEGAKEDDFRLFSRVLKKAKSLVASWGGELHFVYLPDSDRYFSKSGPNRIRNHIRRRVIDIVSELKIDLIDVHEVLARLPDARQHFYYPGSHYNERGYQLTADIVAKALGAETKN